MKIIDKYILKQAVIGFLTILISLTILIWLTQSLRMIDMIVTKGVSVQIFLKMTLLILPNFLQILAPLALFAVTLFVFTRMQSDKELMVLSAVGMSSAQLIKSLCGFACILVVLGYLLTLFVIPQSYTELREMKWKIANNLSHLLLQEGQFSSLGKGKTLYIRERLGDGKVKGIIAYEAKGPKKTILIADEGVMFQTNDGIGVTLGQGSRQEYNTQTKGFSVLKFDKNTISFNDKSSKESRKTDVRELPLSTLLNATKHDVPDRVTYRKYKVEAMKRLTQPLYNLLFVLLAAAGVLSGYYNRRGKNRQIQITIVVALLIQSAALAFENIAAKNLWGLILMGANIAIPLTLLYFWLFCGKKITMLKLTIILLSLGLTTNAFAFPKVKTDNLNKKDPIQFAADDVSYNIKTDELVATGNVEFQQNGTTFTTEKVFYNKKKDLVTMPEPIQLVLVDGTKTNVDNMTLEPQTAHAIAKAMESRFIDGSFMNAQEATMQDGKVFTLTNASYTPCDVCENKAPLWQLSAKQVTQDLNDHVISYKHAFLDIKDIPVFYWPYLQMPDFTVKRKTGFLAPGFRHNSTMGFAIDTPVFVNIADNQNLLLTPIISMSVRPLGIADYSARFTKGQVHIAASGTQSENMKNEGHVKAGFTYDIAENWRLKGQYFHSITDTYFRRYDIPNVDDSDSFLESYLGAEYFGNRLYARMQNWGFQSLVNGVSSRTIPIILPTFNVIYNTQRFGETPAYAYTQLNGAFYNTREYFKSNRLSITQGIKVPYTLPIGIATETNVSARLDGYAIDTGNDPIANKKPNETYDKGRFYPTASLKASYPLIASSANYSQILEPIGMLVVAPNSHNSEDIPNIDSQVFDFSDNNLFSDNRFVGYDRVEYGTRINYGAQWKIYNHNKKNQSLSALFGQSYHFQENNELSSAMGYDHHLSDYVGQIQANYDFARLTYRFRLDQKNFGARKNDIDLALGNQPLQVGVRYLFQGNYRLDNTSYSERKEVTFWAKSQLTKSWQISGDYRYNLKKNGGPIQYRVNLRYDNECTAVLFDLKKSYARDRNYRGDTSFMVKFILKTLGGVGQ
ncbi:MAG: LPS export ABC transporter permease LptF [Alphaproteobacteria bacterium]|nr:LPS export ABC transporter permease LptF [Alphaproteobacteria bacterium]